MIQAFSLISMLLLPAVVPAGIAASSQPIPIILDTDIGSDIDDAFALALIMKSPELELLGVTTVSGDTAARARIAAKMLWEAGGKWRQVPVVAGVPGPPQHINQAPWASDFVSPQLLQQSAVDFLRSKLHRYPGQITLIAIGELTNVAALIKTDPLAAKKIKRLAIMGGSVARGYEPGSKPDAEWNIKSNSAAAQVVFASSIPISMTQPDAKKAADPSPAPAGSELALSGAKRQALKNGSALRIPMIMAPLDVTAMLNLDAAGRSRLFHQDTPIASALAALYHLWNRETPILFDPMAVALVINPRICQTKDLAIEVDDQGFTRVAEGKPANATVALSTDPAKFFEFYLDRVAPVK
jgi:inosine-uridine nucleoside N-ribohydrolase